MNFLPLALKGAILSSLAMSLVACGGASGGGNDKRGSTATDGDKLAGSVDDCYSLGQGYGPAQSPGFGPNNAGTATYDEEVTYSRPCNGGSYPGQNPGQNPGCDYGYNKQGGCDNYLPVDTGGIGYEPNPWPVPKPGTPGTCGKNGNFCDNGSGGPGQWPGQAIGGGIYNQGDVQACLGAFRGMGFNTQGQWGIQVLEARGVNVLGNSIIEDRGLGNNIVIIKSVGVLGSTAFRLLNPNALYCIQNVAVMAETNVTSCLQSNVVWGSNVNVLAAARSRMVDCR